MSTSDIPSLGKEITEKYTLIERLGAGSFGEVYSGIQLEDNDEVAVKLELYDESKKEHQQLRFEAQVYKQMQGGRGVPELLWYGEDDQYNVLVIERLGLSLEDLFDICNRRFSLKTVLQIAEQMLSRLEHFHSRCYIHRDIKPDNFLMGLGSQANRIYLIDYGLAKRYRDARTQRHNRFERGKNLTGTARYASLNASLGGEQGRKDDVESLGFVLMYFLRGSLPWQGLKAANKRQKYEKIAEKKLSTSTSTLCQGYPIEFAILLNYSRCLRFEEEPDYSYLKQILRMLYKSMNYQYDSVFDWSKSLDPSVREMYRQKGTKKRARGQRRFSGLLESKTHIPKPKPKFGAPTQVTPVLDVKPEGDGTAVKPESQQEADSQGLNPEGKVEVNLEGEQEEGKEGMELEGDIEEEGTEEQVPQQETGLEAGEPVPKSESKPQVEEAGEVPKSESKTEGIGE